MILDSEFRTWGRLGKHALAALLVRPVLDSNNSYEGLQHKDFLLGRSLNVNWYHDDKALSKVRLLHIDLVQF